MIDSRRKMYICFCAMIFYIYNVFTKNNSFNFRSLLNGVPYNGYIIFYAMVIFLFGIIIFTSFGDVEKYITGYGILEIIRAKKRSTVVKNIILTQFIKIIKIMSILIVLYFIAIIMQDKIVKSSDVKLFVIDVCIFIIVSYSLMLWQALFEIIWDSRIAIIVNLAIPVFHLYIGDIIFTYNGNQYLNLLFYTNLSLSLRRELLDITTPIIFFVLFEICFVQIILIHCILKRKDIYTIRT